MALFGFEGFDHYASAGGDMLSRSGKLQWSQQQYFNIVTGRNGYGKALSGGMNSYVTASLAQTFVTMILGLAINFPSDGLTERLNLNDTIAGVTQCYITFNNSSGVISVFRGDNTLLAASPANSYAFGAWSYVQIKATISATVGIMQVVVNSALVLNLTGLNNQFSANAWINGFGVVTSGNFGAQPVVIDDLYIADTTTGPGANPCNNFLGDVTVNTVFPTGNGAVQWTPLANANWQEVDEIAMDGDASYNVSNVSGQVDTFNVGPLRSLSVIIYGVQVTGAYRKDDTSTHTIQQRVVSGASVGNGVNTGIGASYVYLTDLFVLDPATSLSWTSTAANAVQIGYQLNT